eukprot:Gregarina_sp_Poly_1__3671@NODE_2082_length_2718_cov_205_459449_g1343_i0_p1_GENE_NODE_2082_length_2718_cov_205_459449_g1343_i0NODE_2082_length_2718_cov_205_459449_g1343_i0_p1_ORF_typecomplete_len773_score132_29RRM_1/PF00076_22/0_58RRM_1/PF00076_22/1_2e03RRM_1/PF00076_22/9_9e03RRM_1/PF00076_22/3_4e05RRM_5/PF13893_6/0_18RRM_occluded/PF16842_5/5_4e02RRM_occluded/PF16842_5/0_92RRM_2/PF04059_12/5_1e03RRM_2/PF04059_12/0_55_NODE_2082_length_2718_cov_205_459449_g1343_i03982680
MSKKRGSEHLNKTKSSSSSLPSSQFNEAPTNEDGDPAKLDDTDEGDKDSTRLRHTSGGDDDDTDEETNEDLPVTASRRPVRESDSNTIEQQVDNKNAQDAVPATTGTATTRCRKRRSGWSSAPSGDTAQASTDSRRNSVDTDSKAGGFSGGGFSGPPSGVPAEQASAFSTVVAGDAALQTSRLHLLAQQMGLSAEQIKAARELYVGNLPPQLEVSQLVEFLNAAMLALKGNVLPGPPAVKGWRATEGHFAFIEFRIMEEANNGLVLNSINCLGYSLRIGRPKTYPEALALVSAAQQGTLPASSGVTNGILTGVSLGTTVNKELLGAAFSEASSRLSGTIITCVGAITPPPDAMCLRNLPPPDIFTEEKARELLTAFGALKFFVYFGLPAQVAIDECLETYLEKTAHSDVNGFIDAPSPTTAAGDSVVSTTDGSTAQKEVQIKQEGNSDAQTAVNKGEASSLIQQLGINKPPRKHVAELFVEDLLSDLPAQQSVCFFEYHNPLDSQNLTTEIGRMKLAGRRPTLSPAEDPLAEEEITRLVNFECIKQKCQGMLENECHSFPVPTRCLFFTNLVSHEELLDDAEYSEIVDDVKLECKLFGKFISMEVPRPLSNGDYAADEAAGVGYVFVEMATVEDACRVRKALNGRKYGGRKVKGDYLSERKYLNRDFRNPIPNTDPLHSSSNVPELAAHVPGLLKQMEEIEKAAREAARAAATAAANASFTGALCIETQMPMMPALMDIPKPNFDEDVCKDEEAMEEDED